MSLFIVGVKTKCHQTSTPTISVPWYPLHYPNYQEWKPHHNCILKAPLWWSSLKLLFHALLFFVGFKWNMVLEGKRPTMSNNRRGFYVRMKLLHRHAGLQQQEKKKNLCFKYYKWLLWFSLLLYFLSSCFFTHKPIPLSKTHVSESKTVVSRALFESSNSTFIQQGKNINRGMLSLSL